MANEQWTRNSNFITLLALEYNRMPTNGKRRTEASSVNVALFRAEAVWREIQKGRKSAACFQQLKRYSKLFSKKVSTSRCFTNISSHDHTSLWECCTSWQSIHFRLELQSSSVRTTQYSTHHTLKGAYTRALPKPCAWHSLWVLMLLLIQACVTMVLSWQIKERLREWLLWHQVSLGQHMTGSSNTFWSTTENFEPLPGLQTFVTEKELQKSVNEIHHCAWQRIIWHKTHTASTRQVWGDIKPFQLAASWNIWQYFCSAWCACCNIAI